MTMMYAPNTCVNGLDPTTKVLSIFCYLLDFLLTQLRQVCCHYFVNSSILQCVCKHECQSISVWKVKQKKKKKKVRPLLQKIIQHYFFAVEKHKKSMPLNKSISQSLD